MSENFSSEDSSDDEKISEEVLQEISTKITRDFNQEARLVIEQDSLPKKSQDRYKLVYDIFMKWKNDNQASSFDQSVLICYFEDCKKKVCPATLWSIWSILKKTLSTKHNVDIANYLNLKSILKNNSKGYKPPKKSLIFSWEQITNFINNAPNNTYLGLKVLLIFGVYGGLRCAEFMNIKCCHVEDLNCKFLVSIVDTKAYIDRSFIIGPLFYQKVKDYVSLRPQDLSMDRFFLQYLSEKCYRQNIGKNKVGSTPSAIASYLGLENPSKYTGHCFRRTSAILLSNSGANIILVKQSGDWRSDSVASGYIAESIRSKIIIYESITHEKQVSQKVLEEIVPSINKVSLPNIIEKPATSTTTISKTSSYSIVDPNKEIENLHLTYEDFCDDLTHSNDLMVNPINSAMNFKTANGLELPPSVLTDKKENFKCQSFTSLPPVKLSFNVPKKISTHITALNQNILKNNVNSLPITNENVTPVQSSAKRMRLEENNDFHRSELENIAPKENVKQISTKDSIVRFDNCTISGNITNNYYYYGNNNT